MYLRAVALVLTLMGAPLAAEAQQAGKVQRLGILFVGRQEGAERVRQSFSERLRELGWQQDRNLIIDVRFTDATDRLSEIAASLVASRPDVLIAVGPYPAQSLKEATQTIPIVFAMVADPVGRGLVVGTLARPGGNITGVSHFVGAGSALGKPAQLLSELVPRAERFAYLINPINPNWRSSANIQESLARVARELKISAQAVEARSVDEVPAAIEAAVRSRADGLIVTPDSVFGAVRETIVRLAANHRLPTIYPFRTWVEAGGLMSYAANPRALLRRTADYVDKILRGTKPADLPIEQPSNFELVINLKTAKTLGLTIPSSILLRADRVIE